jgi:hypothetical protein
MREEVRLGDCTGYYNGAGSGKREMTAVSVKRDVCLMTHDMFVGTFIHKNQCQAPFS